MFTSFEQQVTSGRQHVHPGVDALTASQRYGGGYARVLRAFEVIQHGPVLGQVCRGKDVTGYLAFGLVQNQPGIAQSGAPALLDKLAPNSSRRKLAADVRKNVLIGTTGLQRAVDEQSMDDRYLSLSFVAAVPAAVRNRVPDAT